MSLSPVVKALIDLGRIGTDTDERKYLLRWLVSFSRRSDGVMRVPWIPYSAVEYLAPWITRSARVFEFGSGGSTLFWLDCEVDVCVSVEHNQSWHSKVRELSARSKSVTKLDLRFVAPVPQTSVVGNASDPKNFACEHMRGFSFEDYVKVIQEFEDESFDVLLVDGRARPSCIAYGISKVRMGGAIVVDNSDRSSYFAFNEKSLEGFERVRFKGCCPRTLGYCQTDIFIRH